jgi:hypothetical protein
VQRLEHAEAAACANVQYKTRLIRIRLLYESEAHRTADGVSKIRFLLSLCHGEVPDTMHNVQNSHVYRHLVEKTEKINLKFAQYALLYYFHGLERKTFV